MKRRAMTFLIISVLFAGAALAQPAAGGLFVGGSFNFSTISDKEKTSTATTSEWSSLSFHVSPRVGYFLSENLAVGAGIGFSTSSLTEYDVPNEIFRTSSFGIAPFVRYYMGGDNFGLYGEGMISMGFGGSSTTVGNITIDGPPTNNLSIGVSPGVYYFISENFALEAQFGFFGLDREVVRRGEGDAAERDIVNEFQLNLNPNTITFGIMYQF